MADMPFAEWMREVRRIAKEELQWSPKALASLDGEPNEETWKEEYYLEGYSPREAWAEEYSRAQ